MNLLVFCHPDGNTHFTLERIERPDPSELEGGWWLRLQSRIRNGYRRLRQQFAYQERMLGRLRHADRLSVFHAVGRDSARVEKDLRKHLRVGYSKHSTWLVVDAALALLGGLLAWLPGPNIFFFYPAIRALGHYLARKGASRAGQVELSFSIEPLIDRVEEAGPSSLEPVRDELGQLEKRYSMDPLEELLESEVYGR